MSHFMGVDIFWIGLSPTYLGCWRLTLSLARKCTHCAHMQMDNQFLSDWLKSGSLTELSETIAVNVRPPNKKPGFYFAVSTIANGVSILHKTIKLPYLNFEYRSQDGLKCSFTSYSLLSYGVRYSMFEMRTSV